MSERKATPDILGELLLGRDTSPHVEAEPATPETTQPEPVVVRKPKVEPKPRQKAKTKPIAKVVEEIVVEKPKAEKPKKLKKKKSFEYRTVSFQDHDGWRPRFVDGIEVPKWSRGPLITSYLRLMATEGWQLVAATSGQPLYGNMDKYQLFFMRRK